jgi:plasmid stabilization system protein ParE
MRKTIIQPQVYKDVAEIYNFIKNNSSQNAFKFKQEVKNKIDEVEKYPEIYPQLAQLNRKKIHYRYIIVFKSWKRIYKVLDQELIFLAILHSAQSEDNYKNINYK